MQSRFVSPPARHDGTKRVKMQVSFSGPIEETPDNVGEHGVDVEGAATRKRTRSAGEEVVWEFETEPDSAGDSESRTATAAEPEEKEH